MLWHEDKDALYLVKPAGLPVFAPHADPDGDCVLARLRQLRPEQDAAWPDGFAGGIGHRLDVSTSGLLYVARTPEALAAFRDALAGRALSKRYLFLTARDVPWSEHAVESRLAHHRSKRDRMIVQRGRDTPHRGRWYDAHTALSRRGQVGDLHRWEAIMRSGVMHQIRAHAASVGLALAGDRLYGGGPLPGAPAGVDFALHHAGASGAPWSAPPCPPPDWWAEL